MGDIKETIYFVYRRNLMGDIKSTLDLVMGKTKNLKFTNSERINVFLKKVSKAIDGLIFKFKNNAIKIDKLEEHITALSTNYKDIDVKKIFTEKLLSKIDLAKENIVFLKAS